MVFCSGSYEAAVRMWKGMHAFLELFSLFKGHVIVSRIQFLMFESLRSLFPRGYPVFSSTYPLSSVTVCFFKANREHVCCYFSLPSRPTLWKGLDQVRLTEVNLVFYVLKVSGLDIKFTPKNLGLFGYIVQTNHPKTSIIFTGPTHAPREGIIQGIYIKDQKAWGYLVILSPIEPKVRKQVKSPELRRHKGGKD